MLRIRLASILALHGRAVSLATACLLRPPHGGGTSGEREHGTRHSTGRDQGHHREPQHPCLDRERAEVDDNRITEHGRSRHTSGTCGGWPLIAR